MEADKDDSTYAGSLGGDAANKVLALALSHLVDGGRLEAVELAESGGLQKRRDMWGGEIRCK